MLIYPKIGCLKEAFLMAKKIDERTIEAIKQLLQQYGIKEDEQIMIDLKNNMLTEYSKSGIADLIGLQGTISNERAAEWTKEVEEMRKDW